MLIIEKIVVFVLIFAILIVLREGTLFGLKIRSLFNDDSNVKDIKLPTRRLIILGCAIAYIFTIIFTGFRLF